MDRKITFLALDFITFFLTNQMNDSTFFLEQDTFYDDNGPQYFQGELA